jgi:hypothetical protein
LFAQSILEPSAQCIGAEGGRVVRDRVADQVLVRLFDRSRESVPAGFPEPYLDRRFTSDFEGSHFPRATKRPEHQGKVTGSVGVVMVTARLQRVGFLSPLRYRITYAKLQHKSVQESLAFEKSDSLLQPIYIIHNSMAIITAVTHPPTKHASLMAVIKVESRGRLTATLTKTIERPGWTVFFPGWRWIAEFTRPPAAAGIPPIALPFLDPLLR